MNSLSSLWRVYYLLGSHYYLSIHSKDESVTHSVVFDSVTPWTEAKLLCPWNSSGKNIGMCSHSLFQGILLTKDQTWVSCTVGRFFTIWATREAQWSETKPQISCDVPVFRISWISQEHCQSHVLSHTFLIFFIIHSLWPYSNFLLTILWQKVLLFLTS